MSNPRYITNHPDGYWVRIPIAHHYDGDDKRTEFCQKIFPYHKHTQDEAITWRDNILDFLGRQHVPDMIHKRVVKFNRKRGPDNGFPVGVCHVTEKPRKNRNQQTYICAQTKFEELLLCRRFTYGHVRSYGQALELAIQERQRQVKEVIKQKGFYCYGS